VALRKGKVSLRASRAARCEGVNAGQIGISQEGREINRGKTSRLEEKKLNSEGSKKAGKDANTLK